MKKWIEKCNISRRNISIVFFILFVIITRYLIRLFPNFQIFGIFFDFYAHIILIPSQKLLILLGHDTTISLITNQLFVVNSKIINVNYFYFSMNQVLAIVFLVILTKAPNKNRLVVFLIGYISILVYNVFRVSMHAIFNILNGHDWLFNLLLIPRWLIVIMLTYFFWERFPVLKDFIITKLRLTTTIYKHLFINCSLILISYYLVIIVMYNNYFIFNGMVLIDLILNISSKILNISGYYSYVDFRSLRGTHVGLYMDDACIGINLMFLFASFIALLPGQLKHKLWFIPMGLILIILFNSLRIILIFINLVDKGRYTLPIEIHDLFTFPVYVFIFFLWTIWINKFYLKNKSPT